MTSLALVQSRAIRTNTSHLVCNLIEFVAFPAFSRIVVAAGIVGLIDLTMGTIDMIIHQLITQIYQYVFESMRV